MPQPSSFLVCLVKRQGEPPRKTKQGCFSFPLYSPLMCSIVWGYLGYSGSVPIRDLVLFLETPGSQEEWFCFSEVWTVRAKMATGSTLRNDYPLSFFFLSPSLCCSSSRSFDTNCSALRGYSSFAWRSMGSESWRCDSMLFCLGFLLKHGIAMASPFRGNTASRAPEVAPSLLCVIELWGPKLRSSLGGSGKTAELLPVQLLEGVFLVLGFRTPQISYTPRDSGKRASNTP